MNDLQPPSEMGNIKRPTLNTQRRRKAYEVLAWIKNFFDYLGASREEPPPGAELLASPIWLGIWWGLMVGLILLFCGQTSKFIYIDF